jgi:hypothetical protein
MNSLLVFICITLYAAATLGQPEEARLGLDVVKHASCKTRSEAGWQPSIVFSDSREAPLVPDKNEVGCYSIEGDVTVYKRITSKMQIYVEIRNKPDQTSRPEPCYQPNITTGCGGFGSCVYCDDCKSLQSENAQIAKVKLTSNGKPLECNDSALEVGKHSDIKLSFCMPTKTQFLNAAGIDESVFDDLVDSHDSKSSSRHGVFMNIYVYDIDISSKARQERQYLDKSTSDRDSLLRSQYLLRQSNARNAGVPFNEPPPLMGMPLELTDEQYNALPLHKTVVNQDYIACHKVYGNLYFDADQAAVIGTQRAKNSRAARQGRARR